MSNDLSDYENYDGPPPPEIEQEKYRLSVKAREQAEDGNYIEAAETKEEIADICRSQGKERDAHLLEVTAHEYHQKAKSES